MLTNRTSSFANLGSGANKQTNMVGNQQTNTNTNTNTNQTNTNANAKGGLQVLNLEALQQLNDMRSKKKNLGLFKFI